ncbi:MAG: pyridoxine 5'-phosphate synthase [Gemmatimonadota bacterium]|nr:pyridoxine 5'-phosphate synthase [Gemmatimonadota bacterium]
MRLYINIDHVATVRQARRTDEPDPVRAAVLAELGGADGITIHLREDRRHIDDRDARLLAATVRTGINFELAAAARMVDIAVELAPMQATLVPEKREEVTTEGGLDLASPSVRDAVGTSLRRLEAAGIRTSLFIDPDRDAVGRSAKLGANAVELHTGEYANASSDAEKAAELARLAAAAARGHALGLAVHAGHGLTYENVTPVAALPHVEELNIGHSVVSRAVLVGLERAAREMKSIVLAAPGQVAEPGRWIPPIGY